MTVKSAFTTQWRNLSFLIAIWALLAKPSCANSYFCPFEIIQLGAEALCEAELTGRGLREGGEAD